MCGGMLIFIWKSGRLGKYCVGAAKLCSPVIHHLNEVFNRTANVFCNLKCDVIC